MSSRAVQPYSIAVPDETLTDLQDRLSRTRWTDEITGSGWDAGTDLAYLKELVAYWQNGFDWRAQEAKLNQLPQVMVDINGTTIHAIHYPGKGRTTIPLLMLHGWPDSIWRMSKIVPLLADPGAHGADDAIAFDVVVPSIPGYGFSERGDPTEIDGQTVIAQMIGLMRALGYERFGVHGGDVGSSLGEWIARSQPDAVIGLHLTDVPYGHIFQPADNLSDAEQAYMAAGQQWGQHEGAYAMQQSTKPQSLAVGLNDSPAGLAAWIIEKFYAWSDCNGELESRFSKDDLLTNLTIYWATETIGTSFRAYVSQNSDDDGNAGTAPRLDSVPAGFAIFPKDIVPAPREWGERFFDIRRWTEMPRGGHFAAFEEPELLAGELRTFFGSLR